jgi:hypothetical protein
MPVVPRVLFVHTIGLMVFLIWLFRHDVGVLLLLMASQVMDAMIDVYPCDALQSQALRMTTVVDPKRKLPSGS